MKGFRRFIPIGFPNLLVSILFLIETSSCRLPYEVNNTPPPVPKNAWLVQWMNEPICQPPCFLGITPGRTTITETVQLLSQIPDIHINYGPVTKIGGTDKEIDWDFTTDTQGDGARMITDKQGKIISIIDMSPGIDQSLTLAEIISSFGPPDHIYLRDCQVRQCAVHIIFISSGMVLDLLLPAHLDNKYSVKISPNQQVREIWFFPPSKEGYIEAFGIWADSLSEKQIQWNGYTTYEEK